MGVGEHATRAFLRGHQWVYEHTGGRVGHRMLGLRNLLLHTTGAKTGQRRTAALVYVPDGDDRYVVVGSNGGAPRAPGWVHNVRADPHVDVQVGAKTMPAVATVLDRADDPEYVRLWTAVNDNNRTRAGGRYDAYQRRTSRTIPVVILDAHA